MSEQYNLSWEQYSNIYWLKGQIIENSTNSQQERENSYENFLVQLLEILDGRPIFQHEVPIIKEHIETEELIINGPIELVELEEDLINMQSFDLIVS